MTPDRDTERSLLERAAKAAGYVLGQHSQKEWAFTLGGMEWNPLTDDGDALRLAVRLGISTMPYPIYNEAERHSVIAKQRRRSDMLREVNPTEAMELYGDDPCAATRRAIVRAAAEIGRAME